jgi:hypothetical protein
LFKRARQRYRRKTASPARLVIFWSSTTNYVLQDAEGELSNAVSAWSCVPGTSDEEVVSILFAAIIGGFANTVSALTFALLLLAQHPEVYT